MIGERLVVVGGVWLQAESVPGVAVINLCTGASVEYCLDTVSYHLLFMGIQVQHPIFLFCFIMYSFLVSLFPQSSISWPLMLHSFCSEQLDQDRSKVTLIGGGGNCFSFGTHLNSHPVTLDLSPAISECATSPAGETLEEGIAN